MKYKTFKIENYKGIEKLEINFAEENLLVLSGLNESGKTSVLDAINLWGLMSKKIFLENGKKNALLPKYKSLWTGDISISAVLDIKNCKSKILKDTSALEDNAEIKFSYSVKNSQFEASEPAKSLIYPNTTIEKKKSDQLLSSILENCPDILYYEDFCYDVPKEISFQLETTITDICSINLMWKSILSDAFLSFKEKKQNIQTEITFENFIQDLSQEEKRESALNTLSQLSNYISNQIKEPWDKKINLAGKSSFKEIKLECILKDLSVNFRFEVISENGSKFVVNERSKGFKWFFSFIMLTTFRQSRNPNTLFLLDEPASNLHASVQEEITQLIIELTNKCQVIYTTHSPYMLDPLYINNILLMINEEEAEFVEYPKIQVEKAQKFISQSKRDLHMRPILDFLYFSYPRILPNQDSIFVEGYGDYLHLQFFRLITKSKELLNLIPFSGAGTMKHQINYLKTQNYRIKILLDNDKNGRDAKQNYIEEFSLNDNEIFLQSDFNAEGKVIEAIEDIYTAVDKNNIFMVELESIEKHKKKGEKNKLKNYISEILKNPEKIQTINLETKTQQQIANIFNCLNKWE